MALGTFTPPAGGKTGSFNPQANHDKPLIVVPRRFEPEFKSRQYPDPKPAVFYDVVDLLTDTVIIDVVTGSKAIVDRLKSAMDDGATDTPLPVKFVKQVGGNGQTYYSVEPLAEGSQEHTLAVAWDGKYPTRVAEERAKKEAEDRANGAVTPPTSNAPAAATQPSAPLQGIGQGGGQPAPTSAPAAESSTSGATVSDADLQKLIDGLN